MLLASDRSPKAKGGGGLLGELRQQGQSHHFQAAQYSAGTLRRGAHHQALPKTALAQTAIPGREGASRAQMSNEGSSHFAMRSGHTPPSS